jgi:hypothetical protein
MVTVRNSSYRQSLGNTAPTTGSPLPQEYAEPKVQAVRIVNGFTAALPGRARIFFQRIYFAPYPVPLISAIGAPYPKPVDIATIEAPTQQGIVLRTAAFRVYQHTGIGLDDISEVPPSRTAGYFGFSLTIGNRGISDFNTNLVPAGVQPVPVVGSNVKLSTVSTFPGGGQIFPFSGTFTPQGDNTFANYVRPGDLIKARAFILRPPNYDTRLFSVELQGWLANESELDKMVNMLSG